MGKLIFDEHSYQTSNFNVFSGLASPYDKAGDSLMLKLSKSLSVFTVCDGVSNSASPSDSSLLLTNGLDEFFQRRRSLDLEDYLSFLKQMNLKLLLKNYASTLSQIVVFKEQILVLNFGDSQTLLYDHDGEIMYENWPQNVGFSNEDENSTSHVIVNWLGNTQFRLEMSVFDKKMVKSCLIFSDGLLDLIKPKEFELEALKEQLTKKFSELSDSDTLLDDSSFIYIDFN